MYYVTVICRDDVHVHICTSIPYICQQQVKHRKQFQLELTLFRDRLNPKEYVMFALPVWLALKYDVIVQKLIVQK